MRSIQETLDQLLEVSASDLLLSCGSPPRMRKDGRVEMLEAGLPAPTPAEREGLLRERLQPADSKQLQKRPQGDLSFAWRAPARMRGHAHHPPHPPHPASS